MGNDEFVANAKTIVADVLNYYEDQIYVVWLSKVLQNNKALLSTTVEYDTSYVEVTYNGDKEEFYIDVYEKKYNQCIPIMDLKEI